VLNGLRGPRPFQDRTLHSVIWPRSALRRPWTRLRAAAGRCWT